MDALASIMTSPTASALDPSRSAAAMKAAAAISSPGASAPAGLARSSSIGSHKDVRTRVGEFVGSIFYGTLLREAQKSSLKGKYMHGGRGEEVFQGQLNQEIAKKLGRAQNNAITDELTKEIEKYLRLAGAGGATVQAAAASGEATSTDARKGGADQ
ncbi:MAG TPA: hypothetical protein VMV94_02900 [Phycisphaerae bacterium]|nr:hypothetical protein [Phycisphaerae bacterium]